MQSEREVIGMGPEKIREAHEKVAKEAVGRLGIVQSILSKNRHFLRRVIAPVGRR